MFFSLEGALEALPELGQKEQGALRALLPGPLTLLLPNRAGRYPLAGAPAQTGAPDGGRALRAVGSRALMGLRIPLLPVQLAALAALRRPVMQSSANHSGDPETRRLQDVPEDLRRGVDLVLDGGALPGVASTVLDLSDYESQGEWRIAREGPVPRARLQRALG
jgi:L-threonylcarbamoyladenylate synthase